MNEATLEARVHAVLAGIFPSILSVRITHQTSFTLRFGHHTVIVGDRKSTSKGQSRKSYALGRLDVLVSIDQTPAVLLELKAPGHALTGDDRDQARSYARLLNPMPPLFAVSNGTETQVFQTYDASLWQPQAGDESTLQALLGNAMACADADRDGAVRALLGKDPDLWQGIFRKETEKALKRLEGKAEDITRPIVSGASVPRKVVKELQDRFRAQDHVVVLDGPPLSGKTNVLAQFCREEVDGLVSLYLDASEVRHGVMQHVANLFAASVFTSMTADRVRQWLLVSLGEGAPVRLVFVIDGWTPADGPETNKDVHELLTFIDGRSLGLLLALETGFAQALRHTPGRPTLSRFGQESTVVSLRPFDDEEYQTAMELLWDTRRAIPYDGAEHNAEYREPRQFRILCAIHPELENHDKGKDTYVRFSAMTAPWDLDVTWDYFVSDPELVVLLEKLATGFLEDRAFRVSDATMLMARAGNPIISFKSAESALGAGLARLRDLGYISLVATSPRDVRIFAKVREIFAMAAANVVETRIRGARDAESAYRRLVEDTEDLPLGDVVGAKVLVEIGREHGLHLTELIQRLLADRPRKKPLRGGHRLAVLTPHGPVGLETSEETEGMTALENTHPWLILSHVAAFTMRTEGLERSLNFEIFSEVGAFDDILRRGDTILERPVSGFHVHAISGRGTSLCHRSGLVEPITQSMLHAFHRRAGELVALARVAIEGDRFSLANRLFAAAVLVETSTDVEVARAASSVASELKPYLSKVLGSAHMSDVVER